MVKLAWPSLIAHSSAGSDERGTMGGISAEGTRWPGRWKEETEGLVERGGDGTRWPRRWKEEVESFVVRSGEGTGVVVMASIGVMVPLA